MDNLNTFECVVEYLENIIPCSDEVDYSVISKIAGCPAPLFQRIFVYITGITISEYVRKRRLTLAGYELRTSSEKIIDIAVKYGFNSHAAFTRAFNEHHKVSPTHIRNGSVQLNECPRTSFTNIRIVGGKRIMAELRKIEYVEFGARKVVGMMKETSFQKAGEECWGTAFREGLFDRFQEIEQWICKDIDDYIGLGHMSKFVGRDHFQYIIGKFVELDAPVPENMYDEHVPAGTVAKVWIEADHLNDIIDSAYLICSEAIEKTGYKIDIENFYWCDVYTYERYCTPIEKGQKIILDYFLPVIKAE
ncbi:helix-turn-helix domain-containing protein [Paenibacillus sp. SYP-B3998]|uniref:Helix-turn-helix domain-containing protein n=1 Tax=Paenibacillus sp. SYP-B3998 TaxID=2678564 RepID=A0A6G4A2H8_9BACL|nr:helix-turn-helix domain-containing protein [Paenibacillus sp. SYP-B3998]NEW08592.1 helix-turn-helix domain-containing protein [Paenibacillus sp. SYP-B3998]